MQSPLATHFCKCYCPSDWWDTVTFWMVDKKNISSTCSMNTFQISDFFFFFGAYPSLFLASHLFQSYENIQQCFTSVLWESLSNDVEQNVEKIKAT